MREGYIDESDAEVHAKKKGGNAIGSRADGETQLADGYF